MHARGSHEVFTQGTSLFGGVNGKPERLAYIKAGIPCTLVPS